MKQFTKKEELQNEIDFINRKHFIEKYTEFDKWLMSIGFRIGHYWKEPAPHYYSHYGEIIDSMYSTERYVHDILKTNVCFIRDRNKHLFFNLFTLKLYTIEQFKDLILEDAKRIKEENLKQLISVNV